MCRLAAPSRTSRARIGRPRGCECSDKAGDVGCVGASCVFLQICDTGSRNSAAYSRSSRNLDKRKARRSSCSLRASTVARLAWRRRACYQLSAISYQPLDPCSRSRRVTHLGRLPFPHAAFVPDRYRLHAAALHVCQESVISHTSPSPVQLTHPYQPSSAALPLSLPSRSAMWKRFVSRVASLSSAAVYISAAHNAIRLPRILGASHLAGKDVMTSVLTS